MKTTANKNSNLVRRIEALERDRPTNEELWGYITWHRFDDGPLPGEAARIARINRHTPAYLRKLSNEELVQFIFGGELTGEEVADLLETNGRR